MDLPTKKQKKWSIWHERLHKKLLENKNLLPKNSALLVAVSGGQDSIVLLQLMIDLRRLHNWQLHVWHGDHNWHNRSGEIAKELKIWCEHNNINFLCNVADKDKV